MLFSFSILRSGAAAAYARGAQCRCSPRARRRRQPGSAGGRNHTRGHPLTWAHAPQAATRSASGARGRCPAPSPRWARRAAPRAGGGGNFPRARARGPSSRATRTAPTARPSEGPRALLGPTEGQLRDSSGPTQGHAAQGQLRANDSLNSGYLRANSEGRLCVWWGVFVSRCRWRPSARLRVTYVVQLHASHCTLVRFL